MRLWHPELLQELPEKRLLALHMSLCKVRQKPWGKPTPKTWYYNLSWSCFVWYHSTVVREMAERGWNPATKWLNAQFRGKLPPAEIPNDYLTNYLSEFETVCFDKIEKQRRDLKKWGQNPL